MVLVLLQYLHYIHCAGSRSLKFAINNTDVEL